VGVPKKNPAVFFGYVPRCLNPVSGVIVTFILSTVQMAVSVVVYCRQLLYKHQPNAASIFATYLSGKPTRACLLIVFFVISGRTNLLMQSTC